MPISAVVTDESLTEHQHKCPVCLRMYPSSRSHHVISIQPAPKVLLVECPNCHAMSADRLPLPEYLTELYNPVHYEGTLSSNHSLSAACANRMVKTFDFSTKSHWHIVDYGGGNGELARALASKIESLYPDVTTQTTVIDVFDQVSEKGSSEFCSVDDFLVGALGGYDMMIASAVLEHIPQLQPVLAQMVKNANPNAYFYGRTPYEAPLAQLIPGYGIRWPRHIHDLGPDFWEAVPKVYDGQFRLIKSQPSLVETTFSASPLRTLFAYILKFPAVLEAKIRPMLGLPPCVWRLVGGWEAYLTVNPQDDR